MRYRAYIIVICLLMLSLACTSTLAAEAFMVRVGDMTAHGAVLSGAGSPTVLIGGSPAWRAGVDLFCCPLFFQNTPHGCGYVQGGSTTVLINGSPASFVGSYVVETFGINQIITGCQTVVCGQ